MRSPSSRPAGRCGRRRTRRSRAARGGRGASRSPNARPARRSRARSGPKPWTTPSPPVIVDRRAFGDRIDRQHAGLLRHDGCVVRRRDDDGLGGGRASTRRSAAVTAGDRDGAEREEPAPARPPVNVVGERELLGSSGSDLRHRAGRRPAGLGAAIGIELRQHAVQAGVGTDRLARALDLRRVDLFEPRHAVVADLAEQARSSARRAARASRCPAVCRRSPRCGARRTFSAWPSCLRITSSSCCAGPSASASRATPTRRPRRRRARSP